LRAVTGKIHVWPFRSIDGGHIVLRAKFRFTLASLLSEKRLRDVLQTPLERIVTLDLFEPTQRIRHREQIMEIRKNRTEREAAAAAGITTTAANHAARLGRLMQQQGLSDPYVLVTKPPADYSMLRRHKHHRFHFEPLTGYPLEWK
jgi:site-specific DNA recombinase